MRFRKLMRYLQAWQSAGLIDEEQAEKIAAYMKVESRKHFLKLIKVLFVIGGFWVIFGFAATLKLINIEILRAIGRFLYEFVAPIIALAKAISPEHYREIVGGVSCLLGWGFFQWFGMRVRRRSELNSTELGFLLEKELRLGTAALTIGYILASAAWQFFNYAIYPTDPYMYAGEKILFPYFSLVGMIFFLVIAYRMRDQIALLFSIGFLAHTIGLYAAYFFACYVIGVQMPVVQLIVGILLLLVGIWHIEKVRSSPDAFLFSFGRTYEWTGLLLIYLSLWIMSIWGITYSEDYWSPPRADELWIANLLFIGASLCALFYGALKEDRMFFNFGLTFFIIETYTLFFSRIWNTIGAAFGSFLLGIMLIATGYLLRHLWLTGRIFKKS